MNEEVRRARAAARRLSEPLAALTALLSAGEGLRHLVAESPEDLPLVAFSPFGGLPEPPARASAGGLPETARGGRAPALPGRAEKAAPPPAAAALPSTSRPASASVSRPDGPEPGPRPPAPVFPLRPRADLRPATAGRAGRSGSDGKAAASMTDGGTVTPRSLLDVLATGATGERAAANGGSASGVPPVREPGGNGEPGRAARPESRGAAAALPVPDLLETLLESAARTGRRRHGSHPSPGERRPDDAGDGAEEILVKAGARFLEPSAVAVADPAARASAVAVDSISEPPARADLPSPPVSVLREPTLSPGTAFDAPLDGELLADLVNEVLIEQARRNGVDLS